MSSESQFPISPPVFQKGRYMPTKSPHVRSCKARLKVSRSVGWVRIMLNLRDNAEYRSWFQHMSSPR